MGIWRGLKDGIRDAAIGLQYMGRGHVTNEQIEAAQRELDGGWQPDVDEMPQDWNDLREEQSDYPQYHEPEPGEDPTRDPEKGPRYYGDGRIVGENGELLALGISKAEIAEACTPEEPEPDFSDYEPDGYEEGPEPGTNEWYYLTGNYVDPEPDWSTNPAISPVNGHRYYDDGRVLDYDGKELQPSYTPKRVDDLGYPDIEIAPF